MSERIIVRCSECASKLRVKAEVAGRRFKCPKCGQVTRAELAPPRKRKLSDENTSPRSSAKSVMPNRKERTRDEKTQPVEVSQSLDNENENRRRPVTRPSLQQNNGRFGWLALGSFTAIVCGGIVVMLLIRYFGDASDESNPVRESGPRSKRSQHRPCIGAGVTGRRSRPGEGEFRANDDSRVF